MGQRSDNCLSATLLNDHAAILPCHYVCPHLSLKAAVMGDNLRVPAVPSGLNREADCDPSPLLQNLIKFHLPR